MTIPSYYPQLLSQRGRVSCRRRSQSDHHSSHSACLTPRPLRSTGITPLHHYYEPLRLSYTAASQVIDSLHGLLALTNTVMGLPGSRLICCRALPSVTPGGTVSARSCFFPTVNRLHHLRKDGHHQLCNEAESGSLVLRLTTSPSAGFNPFRPLYKKRGPTSSPDWVTPYGQVAATY